MKSGFMDQADKEQKCKSEELVSLLNGNRELAVLYDIASYLNRQIDVRYGVARITNCLGLVA